MLLHRPFVIVPKYDWPPSVESPMPLPPAARMV
jgi:hypothetical protein